MFSDEGGVGMLSSTRTRRSRPSLDGGRCAGDFLATFADAGGRRALDARGAVGRRLGAARRAFGLARRAVWARRLALGRPPDFLDFLDFLSVVAARRFAERVRDFRLALLTRLTLLAMTASLPQQP
jgi:hypothetical protein